MKITADMLPEEGGEIIRFFYSVEYPEGATVEELKSSGHKTFRDIGNYFEKEAAKSGNNVL